VAPKAFSAKAASGKIVLKLAPASIAVVALER
jgi:hypothetical protein